MEKLSVACSVQLSLVHDVIPVRTLTNFYFRRGDPGRFFSALVGAAESNRLCLMREQVGGVANYTMTTLCFIPEAEFTGI